MPIKSLDLKTLISALQKIEAIEGGNICVGLSLDGETVAPVHWAHSYDDDETTMEETT